MIHFKPSYSISRILYVVTYPGYSRPVNQIVEGSSVFAVDEFPELGKQCQFLVCVQQVA